MNFCCKSFSRITDGVPCSGFKMLVRDHEGQGLFFLQFRSLDREAPLPTGPAAVGLVFASEMRLIYCPWCGVNLDKFYATEWRDLSELTKTMELNLDHRPMK